MIELADNEVYSKQIISKFVIQISDAFLRKVGLLLVDFASQVQVASNKWLSHASDFEGVQRTVAVAVRQEINEPWNRR